MSPSKDVQESLVKTVLRFDGYRVELASRRLVSSDGRELLLRPKTFEMLVYLLRNTDRVIRKEELLDRLWAETEVEESAVPHCIWEIRNALGDQANNPSYIRTVPKVGYQFITPVTRVFPGPVPSVNESAEDEAEDSASMVSTFCEVDFENPSEVETSTGIRMRSRLMVGTVLVAFALAVLLVYGIWDRQLLTSPALERERKSIGVLPFDNLSDRAEDQYFSDGITDEISAELTRISDLRVIGRTSAFRFNGSNKSLSEIAEEMGVEFLLGGSVRRADGQVRIVAKLIDGPTEEVVWAEPFQGELEDIFAIQSTVAEQIATSLKAELSSEEKRQIEKRFTENAEAYDLYLLGRHYKRLEMPASRSKAVKYYQRAIEQDSEFALAYAGLAEGYALVFSYDPQEKWLDHSEQASARALALDPTIALTHTAKGICAYFRGEFTTAAMEYGRAIALEPQNAGAHREYGLLLYRLGRLEEAFLELKQAHALDPLAWELNVHLVWCYSATGDLDEAFRYARKALELNPDGYWPHLRLGDVYSRLGIYRKAEEYLKQAVEIEPQHSAALLRLGESYLRSGQLDEAVAVSHRALSLQRHYKGNIRYAARVNLWKGDYAKAVEQYEESQTFPPNVSRDAPVMARHRAQWGCALWKLGRQTEAAQRFSESLRICMERLEAGSTMYDPRIIFATVHAIRGEKEEAYRWLEKAIEAGWRDYALLLSDPTWADFQNDRRFQQMMAEVRTGIEEMRHRVEEMDREREEANTG